MGGIVSSKTCVVFFADYDAHGTTLSLCDQLPDPKNYG